MKLMKTDAMISTSSNLQAELRQVQRAAAIKLEELTSLHKEAAGLGTKLH